MKPFLFTLIPLLTSCTENPQKESLDDTTGCASPFSLLHFETRQPSVVRLFFKLNKCDGDGVTGKTNEDFLLAENGAALNAFESLQQIVPASLDYDIRTVLLLDMSGSMINSGDLTQVQDSAWVFVSRLIEHQKVAIYAFDGRQQIQQVIDFTQNPIALRAAIELLSEYTSDDNSTNLNGAAISGDQLLDAYATQTIFGLFQGSLLIITDGTDQAGWNSDDETTTILNTTDNSVYTIGLGTEIDTSHLEKMGKDGYWAMENISGLHDAVIEASDLISNQANSMYMLAYCSPKRNGEHVLNLQMDQIEETFDFNATGFQGGCSDLDFYDHLHVEQLIEGDLVISEVMHTTTAVDEYRGEWFEVYNNTDQQINLKGLVVTSDGEERFSVDKDLLLDRESYALFAARDNPIENGGMFNVHYRYIFTEFALSETDTISLQLPEGQIIDTIVYDSTTDFPLGQGASLSLSTLTFEANDIATNWCESTSSYGLGDIGTPGLPNDTCP